MSVLDLKMRRELTRIAVGQGPQGIDFVNSHRQLYVSNSLSGTISIIDADAQTVLAKIRTGNGTRAFGRFILR